MPEPTDLVIAAIGFRQSQDAPREVWVELVDAHRRKVIARLCPDAVCILGRELLQRGEQARGEQELERQMHQGR